METMNHECYVSFEIAKLLKEAGFDWECSCYYSVNTLHEPNNGFIHIYKQYKALFYDHNRTKMPVYSAPTLDVAQRWVREVKDIDIYIFPTTNTKRGCVYEWGIKTFGRALWVEGQPYTNQYETYEEAQEAGIKKALELILEKGK